LLLNDGNKIGEILAEAMELFKNGKYKDSILLWENALILDKTNATAWVMLGQTNENLGDWNKSIACYDDALKFNPNHQDALWFKKQLLEKLRTDKLDNTVSPVLEDALKFNTKYQEVPWTKEQLSGKLHIKKLDIPVPPVSNNTVPPISNNTVPPISNNTVPPVSNNTVPSVLDNIFHSFENGILRCIRCGSKDEINKYSHKTPDEKKITGGGRHYKKVTTYLGTGGSGIVPVCSHCYKLFSSFKLIQFLAYAILIITFYFFVASLFFFVEPFISGVNPFPSYEDYFALTISIVSVLILVITISKMDSSNINPRKVIKIRGNKISIKPKKAPVWLLYSNVRDVYGAFAKIKIENEFPDRCPYCKTKVIHVDENAILCPNCQTRFSN